MKTPKLQETADLVIFTEEILKGKLLFCAVQIQRSFQRINHAFLLTTVNVYLLAGYIVSKASSNITVQTPTLSF